MRRTFAEKVDHLMDAHRLSLEDVGSVVGVTKTTVARWRAGINRPKMDEALRLARLLGVPLDYLADDAQCEPEPGLSADDLAILRMAHAIQDPAEAERRLMRPSTATGVAPPGPGPGPFRSEIVVGERRYAPAPPTTTPPEPPRRQAGGGAGKKPPR